MLVNAEPIVAFFAMPAALQVEIIPSVEEKKYDFPDGDLISSNALEILLCIYLSMLNSISLKMLVIQEEVVIEQGVQGTYGLLTLLCELTNLIFDDYFEILLCSDRLESIEWDTLRHLSSLLQQKSGLHTTTSRRTLEEMIESWVHP